MRYKKAIIQAKLISGRYRLETLTKHFSISNKSDDLCKLPQCQLAENSHVGDIDSFLWTCPSLHTERLLLINGINQFYEENPYLESPIRACLCSNRTLFILDCSVMEPVITLTQNLGPTILQQLFKLTRNFCFVLHKKRLSLLETVT